MCKFCSLLVKRQLGRHVDKAAGAYLDRRFYLQNSFSVFLHNTTPWKWSNFRPEFTEFPFGTRFTSCHKPVPKHSVPRLYLFWVTPNSNLKKKNIIFTLKESLLLPGYTFTGAPFTTGHMRGTYYTHTRSHWCAPQRFLWPGLSIKLQATTTAYSHAT